MALRLYPRRKRKEMWRTVHVAVFTLMLLIPRVELEAAEELSSVGYGSLVSLDDAIHRALHNEVDIKRAFASLNKEKALYQGSFSEFFPKISAEYFGAVTTGDKNNVNYLDTTLEQPLFKGGKIITERKKRRVRVQTEEKKLEESKLDAELEIRVLYVQLLFEKESTRISQGQVHELLEKYAHVKYLVDNESFPLNELLRIERILQEVKHSLVKHKETYDYLLSVIFEAVGLKEGEALDLDSLLDSDDLEANVDFYLNQARKKDPLYEFSDLKVKEKQFEKRELQADRFPHLSLAARWNKNNDVFVDTNRAMFGAQVKWNIWDFGRLGSKIRAKDYEIEETKWSGQIELRENEKIIRKLFHEARALKEKMRFTEALVNERQELYKNEKIRLVVGELGSGELIDSFLALEEAKIERLRTITEYRVLMARLDRKTAFQLLPKENEFFEDSNDEK